MASLFHPPIKPLLYHHHSTSSSSSLPSITPSPKSSSNTNSYLPRARNLFCSAEFRKRKSCIKRGCICRSALDEASVKYSSEAEQSKAELVSSSKLKLLVSVRLFFLSVFLFRLLFWKTCIADFLYVFSLFFLFGLMVSGVIIV